MKSMKSPGPSKSVETIAKMVLAWQTYVYILCGFLAEAIGDRPRGESEKEKKKPNESCEKRRTPHTST